VVVAILLAPGAAHAGRTQYGWLFDTEVLPERGAEILTWVDERNGRDPNDSHWTTWGWTGLIGVTDQLMLSLPIEFVWRESDLLEPTFTWESYGIEARYRLVSADPVDGPPFAPLVRLAVKRDVATRDAVIIESDVVASTTTPTGSAEAVVDVGFVGAITGDEQAFELRPGAGVSFRVKGDLRLGAEVYSEITLKGPKQTWAAIGPNLAWTHGRFWLSAAFGIGVYHIDTAPRVQWGVMF
jgi:hypothetical protein